MMAVMGTLVFMGAMALATAAIWLSIAPQWRRIAGLLAGRVEQPARPLERLILAERRIAVRCWASATQGPLVPASVRMRAAA